MSALYFYFIDAELGLIYLRVPAWAPFRLQFYCNGHSWLARQLGAEGIGYSMADNAFVRIDDWERCRWRRRIRSNPAKFDLVVCADVVAVNATPLLRRCLGG